MQLPTLNGHRDLWQRITHAVDFAARLRAGRVPSDSESMEPLDADAFAVHSQTDPTGRLVDRMLAHGRQALLLRPELVTKLTDAQLQKARQRLTAQMALVPGGKVTLDPWDADDDLGDIRKPVALAHQANVEAFWLDRLQVSNLQFHGFVREGGYHNESFWAAAAHKRIAGFLDRSEFRGPRFWHKEKFPAGLGSHPVVGICWFEADAFARWQGKRLPADPEWIAAACGPLTPDTRDTIQRRYPWGQEPKTGVTNFWGCDHPDRCEAGTVATQALPEGATDAGIEQLLGNVWEWTSSDFQISIEAENVVMDQPRMSLRGGAFDTYFSDRAACHLQSGDSLFARKRNIGFRCAVEATALVMPDQASDE